MDNIQKDSIRNNVRGRYKQVAIKEIAIKSSCCGSSEPVDFDEMSEKMGYSAEELASVPQGANLGLGCGNPQAIAALKPGEVVLDLGSGAGFDCFLAARQVGSEGLAIGVDMTPEMVTKARQNASKGQFTNTDFRLGEIEHLPVANDTVDVIMSNCVINLSPDKQQVFHEAHRVLKSGGRLAISDVIMTAEMPPEIRADIDATYSGCISGASSIEELEGFLQQAGFTDISITAKDESKLYIKEWLPGADIDQFIVSAIIQAKK
ncbi:arsenite methyltransferase [Paenibacillus marinisediminis]